MGVLRRTCAVKSATHYACLWASMPGNSICTATSIGPIFCEAFKVLSDPVSFMCSSNVSSAVSGSCSAFCCRTFKCWAMATCTTTSSGTRCWATAPSWLRSWSAVRRSSSHGSSRRSRCLLLDARPANELHAGVPRSVLRGSGWAQEFGRVQGNCPCCCICTRRFALYRMVKAGNENGRLR